MRPYKGHNPEGISDTTTRLAVQAMHDYLTQLNQTVGAPSRTSTGDITVINTSVRSAMPDGVYQDIEVSGNGKDLRVTQTGETYYVKSVSEIEALLAKLRVKQTGGCIILAPGTYTLGNTLILDVHNLTFKGTSLGSTIINCLDYNTDIISVRGSGIFIENLTVYHGTRTGNGFGGVGYGRGIVIEFEESATADYMSGPYIRNVEVLNTASWCIYNTGRYAYQDISYVNGISGATTGGMVDGPEHPFPIWGWKHPVGTAAWVVSCDTTEGSRTVTSTAAFGNIRVGHFVTGAGIPHGTRVVAMASPSSITISNKATATATGASLSFDYRTRCRLTVECVLDQVTLAFPNSGGCYYDGYGNTTTRIRGLKTNSYSFGSFAQHNNTAPTAAITMGAVHAYGSSQMQFDDKPIFQSPSAQGGSEPVPHADTDACMLSFQFCISVQVYSPYFEVLSAYCAGGKDWLHSTTGTIGCDKDANGNYIGYRQYWLVCVDACRDLEFYNPYFSMTVRRKDPAELAKWGTYYNGYPARLFRSLKGANASTGLRVHGGSLYHWRIWYNSSFTHLPAASEPYVSGDFYPCFENGQTILTQKASSNTLTSAAAFGSVSVGDPVYGPGIPIGAYVTAKATSSSLTISVAATDGLNENLRFARYGLPWDRDDLLLDGDLTGDRNTPVNITDLQAWCYNTGQTREVTTWPTNAIENMAFKVTTPRLFRLTPFEDRDQTNTTTTANDVSLRTSYAANFRAGMLAFTRGGGSAVGAKQREGLWAVSGRDFDWRQIPYMRIHSSIWSPVYAGDMWMQLGTVVGSDYTTADFRFYSGGYWRDVVQARVAGGLPTDPPETVSDNAIVRYDGTTGKIIQKSGITIADGATGTLSGTNTGDQNEFADNVFRVYGNSDNTKKIEFDVDSWVPTSTTVTLKAPAGSCQLVGSDIAANIFGEWVFDGVNPAVRTPVIYVGTSAVYTGYGFAITDGSGYYAEIHTEGGGLTADRVYEIPDASGILVLQSTVAALYNSVSSQLRTSTNGLGANFCDNTTTSKKLRFVLSSATGNNYINVNTSAARGWSLGDLNGNLAIVGDDPPAVASGALGKVDLTGQTAAIASTNLSNTPPAGMYRVDVYAACTTASGAGAPTLDVNIAWTDNVGATNRNCTAEPGATAFPLPLSATGRTSASMFISVNSGNIAYSTTINAAAGTPQYALYIRVTYLG